MPRQVNTQVSVKRVARGASHVPAMTAAVPTVGSSAAVPGNGVLSSNFQIVPQMMATPAGPPWRRLTNCEIVESSVTRALRMRQSHSQARAGSTKNANRAARPPLSAADQLYVSDDTKITTRTPTMIQGGRTAISLSARSQIGAIPAKANRTVPRRPATMCAATEEPASVHRNTRPPAVAKSNSMRIELQ